MSAPVPNLPQNPSGGASSQMASPSAIGGPSILPTTTAAASKAKKKVTAKKATGPAATKAKAPKKPAAPRVKKPSSATSGKKASGGAGANSAANLAASHSDSIMVDAAIARLDLAKQRSIAVQRKSDPMWYRIEDVVFSQAMDDTSMYKKSILPEQITVVDLALSNVGGLNRSDVTPQAMVCLLEQARRIAYELCMDAQDYAYAAGRADVTQADLILAQELRSDLSTSSSVTTQLPKLNLTAQQVNRAPLPPIPTQCYTGVMLPPKAHQLTARTFDVVSASVVAQKMTQPVPKSPATIIAQAKQKELAAASSSGGYGASRGRQIPIVLKTSVVTSSNDAAGVASINALPLTSASVEATATGVVTTSTSQPPVASSISMVPNSSPTPMDITMTLSSSLSSGGGAADAASTEHSSTMNAAPNLSIGTASTSSNLHQPQKPPM